MLSWECCHLPWLTEAAISWHNIINVVWTIDKPASICLYDIHANDCWKKKQALFQTVAGWWTSRLLVECTYACVHYLPWKKFIIIAISLAIVDHSESTVPLLNGTHINDTQEEQKQKQPTTMEKSLTEGQVQDNKTDSTATDPNGELRDLSVLKSV